MEKSEAIWSKEKQKKKKNLGFNAIDLEMLFIEMELTLSESIVKKDNIHLQRIQFHICEKNL